MSTIPSASPRQSVQIASPRTSTSTIDTQVTTTERTAARRNKAAALRDYYGIGGQQGATPPKSSLDVESASRPDSELDKPDFNPQIYVEKLLKQDGLQDVLRIEAGLLSEIRSLDGEKKALVYDNYSKLITATETIRKMRERMEEGGPGTNTLTPAIGHIAETAASLSREMRQGGGGEVKGNQRVGQQTVRWVLAGPERLRNLRAAGEAKRATEEWSEIIALLNTWAERDVRGVEHVRKKCEAAMEDVLVEGDR